MGIALTPKGQILLSGISLAANFPTTPGAFTLPDDGEAHWFLMELDATADSVVFSASGIGGSSIAFDSAGNIYLAGSNAGTDYPTTPGAYQTTFVQGHVCGGLCQLGFNGGLQHITKVDPAASTLIYSTGLNDPTGLAGSTSNTGLAVDAAGDVFVTGSLVEAAYPFTVPTPSNYSGYLSKLDPTGSHLLFSVPVGGGGVALDTSGAFYIGGMLSSYTPAGLNSSVTPIAPPQIFSWVTQQCLPDNITAYSEAYVMKIDPATGDTVDAQWIDGSAPTTVGITLAGGKVGVTGFTPAPDVPVTPGGMLPATLGTSFINEAYVAAVDFTTSPAAGAPVLACVLDAANLEHVRAVASYQVIALFGKNLGPAVGEPAPDGTDPSIAGVTVTFGGVPAPLLYVSSTQINVEAPPNAIPIMQVTVNGASTSQRQLPGAGSNLNVFTNLSSNEVSCPNFIANGFQPLAMNVDGTMNSCANPAGYGSTVSFFMEGVGTDSSPAPAQIPPGLQVFAGGCPALIQNTSLTNGFVYRVDVQLPSSGCFSQADPTLAALAVTFAYNEAPVGPLVVPQPPGGPIVNFSPGAPMPLIVWVKE